MLKAPPEVMHASTAEELTLLREPPIADVDPEAIDDPGTQVAGFWDKTGLGAARLFSGDTGRNAGRGGGVMGNAWQRLERLRMEEEARVLREKGVPQPLEAATEALQPDKDILTPRMLSPEAEAARQGRAAKVEAKELVRAAREAREEVEPAPEVEPEFGPDPIPASVRDDAIVNEDYVRHLTLGSEDLDRILRERFEQPDLTDGIIGGIRAVGARGDAKIPDEGNVRSLVSSIGNLVEEKLAKLDPKLVAKISDEQLGDMADLLGMNPDRLAENFLGGLRIDRANPGHLAAQMAAGKNLLVSETAALDHLADLAVKAELGAEREAANLAWFQQATLVANLHDAFKGAQTDIARALRALRTPTTTTGDVARHDLNKILDDLGGSKNMEEAIEAYRMAEDVGDRIELAKAAAKLTKTGSQKWSDAIYEVWINSILSGYWSHVKNISGGMVMILGDTAEGFAAATGQLVTKGVRGQERDITFGDVQAKMFGQFMSMREAFIASGKAASYREDPTMLGIGSKFDNRTASLRVDAFSAEGLELSGTWGQVVDASGTLLTGGRAPLRALQAEDAFFKVTAYRGSLFEQAYRSGRLEGKKGDDLSNHIADFVFSPPEDAIKIAQDHARYVTLQTEMVGSWKKWQSGFQGRFVRWLVPFYKTPTNAILYVAERSPVAPWTNRFRTAMEAGGAEAAKAKTRIAMGMAVSGFALYEAVQGNITGGISNDSRIRAAYLRQGIKPYSRRFGDEYVSYAGLEPLSTLIGIFADASEIIQHPDTEAREAEEIVIGLAAAVGYNMSNKTFMAGLAKFFDAVRDPKRRFKSFVKNYANSMVPGSAAFNDMRRFTDDMRRFKATALDPIRARLPGLSLTLKPQRDLWGRVTIENRLRSPYEPNARDKEIARLRMAIEKHPEHYSSKIEYSPDERDWLHKHAGDYAAKSIDAYLKTPDFKAYQKASKQGDELASQKIKDDINYKIRKARERATGELWNDPEKGAGLRGEQLRIGEQEKRKQEVFKERLGVEK